MLYRLHARRCRQTCSTLAGAGHGLGSPHRLPVDAVARACTARFSSASGHGDAGGDVDVPAVDVDVDVDGPDGGSASFDELCRRQPRGSQASTATAGGS